MFSELTFKNAFETDEDRFALGFIEIPAERSRSERSMLS